MISVIALVSCGCTRNAAKEEASVNIEWHEATYGLEEYKEMQPGRPILALFVSDWDLTGQIHRKVFEDETSMEILKGSRFLCIWYDCTEPDSLGMRELKRLKQLALPVTVFVDGSSAEDRFIDTPVNNEKIYDLLRNLRIVAEQVAASDR
ncbi:hypothetical protein NT6N_04000 [Oceaniferula spumae]|uniref:Thioredoxin domain-containing protein n=1 Tax=Oceaniferula spumae TaxID=2979115 RepID=A0AAT9FHA5_9BACT